jgi:hypothetical protein
MLRSARFATRRRFWREPRNRPAGSLVSSYTEEAVRFIRENARRFASARPLIGFDGRIRPGFEPDP